MSETIWNIVIYDAFETICVIIHGLYSSVVYYCCELLCDNLFSVSQFSASEKMSEVSTVALHNSAPQPPPGVTAVVYRMQHCSDTCVVPPNESCDASPTKYEENGNLGTRSKEGTGNKKIYQNKLEYKEIGAVAASSPIQKENFSRNEDIIYPPAKYNENGLRVVSPTNLKENEILNVIENPNPVSTKYTVYITLETKGLKKNGNVQSFPTVIKQDENLNASCTSVIESGNMNSSIINYKETINLSDPKSNLDENEELNLQASHKENEKLSTSHTKHKENEELKTDTCGNENENLNNPPTKQGNGIMDPSSLKLTENERILCLAEAKEEEKLVTTYAHKVESKILITPPVKCNEKVHLNTLTTGPEKNAMLTLNADHRENETLIIPLTSLVEHEELNTYSVCQENEIIENAQSHKRNDIVDSPPPQHKGIEELESYSTKDGADGELPTTFAETIETGIMNSPLTIHSEDEVRIKSPSEHK